MEQERDDSMDEMIGEVPSSMNVGHMNARFHLSKMCTSYSSALLENDRNTLEGVVIGNGVNGMSTTTTTTTTSAKPDHLPFALSNNTSASKRTLSTLYNWNDESDEKHFNFDSNGNVSVMRTEENNASPGSFATLLNQLPQTPSLPQIGSMGDGLLRTQYQLQGTNWYG